MNKWKINRCVSRGFAVCILALLLVVLAIPLFASWVSPELFSYKSTFAYVSTAGLIRDAGPQTITLETDTQYPDLVITNGTSFAQFNSNDKITIANRAYGNRSNLTVCVWVRRDQSSGFTYGGIANHYKNTGPQDRGWWCTVNSYRLSVAIVGDGIWDSDDEIWYSSSSQIFDSGNVGVWHHVAFVFDGTQATGSQLKLYVDGFEDTAPLKHANRPCPEFHHPALDINLGYWLNHTTLYNWDASFYGFLIAEASYTPEQIYQHYLDGKRALNL